jgi:hypothetical protein
VSAFREDFIAKDASAEGRSALGDVSLSEFPRWYAENRLCPILSKDQPLQLDGSPGAVACLIFLFKHDIKVREGPSFFLYVLF